MADQPLWVQVVLGLLCFFGAAAIVSIFFSSMVEAKMESDFRRRKNELELDQHVRDNVFLKSNPTSLERAIYESWGRRRGVDQIRNYISGLTEVELEALRRNPTVAYWLERNEI